MRGARKRLPEARLPAGLATLPRAALRGGKVLASGLGRSVVRLADRPERTEPAAASFRVRLPDGLILPPALRKPARILGRLELRVVRHAGLKATAFLMLATGGFGVVAGGHLTSVFGSLTTVAGLGIEAVQITGQSETSEVDILDSLHIPDHGSLVAFDGEAARRSVEALSWVETATIRKVYPGTLIVEVTERDPFAIWQRGQLLSLVDEDGRVISDVIDPRYARLPMVVGNGAGPRAAELVALLDHAPDLRARVRAASLVSERRWTLTLDNGIEILLPESGAEAALTRIAELDASVAILSRAINRVDLRVADRLIVRLTDEGMEDLGDTLKQREKLLRRRGANA
jgi:cell division protein FtsQ